MRGLIISKGDIGSEKFLNSIISEYDRIICADGAGDFLYKQGILPHTILGDLDSISNEAQEYFVEKKVEFIKYNPEKDFSDTHICIDYLINLGYKKIDIIGALGGRWDHSISNFGLIYNSLIYNIDIKLIGEFDEMFILKPGIYTFEKKEKEHFSVFGIFEDGIVSIEGMKYPLTKRLIKRGESVGLSNEYLENGIIRVHEGSLIGVKSRIID